MKYPALLGLVLLGLVGLGQAATDVILEYRDESSHHHVQSGVAGEQVEGEYGFQAPEGDQYVLQYRAGESGFEAEGEHLPVMPQETEEVAAVRSKFDEAMRIATALENGEFDINEDYSPLYSQATDDVAKARADFKAAYLKAVETGLNVEEMENEVEVEVERRRREAEASAQYLLPVYYTKQLYYPYQTYAPLYQYQYPRVAATTATQVSHFQQPVLSLTHPVYNIGNIRTVVGPAAPVATAPVSTEVKQESSETAPNLPNEMLPGEDEPAALAF